MNPQLIERMEQNYVSIRTQVSMVEIGTALPPLLDEVFGWLEEQGIAPAGAPFFRYWSDGEPVDVEAGVTIKETVKGHGRIQAGVLPAGRYAVVMHIGPYDGIYQTTSALMDWAKSQGLQLQRSHEGKNWGAWVETYLTDPGNEPDPSKWQTEIAILTGE